MSRLKKVLFLLGCNEGPSKRYRCYNHMEALALFGVESELFWDIDPRVDNLSFLGSFSAIVNFRSGFNERVARLYRNARTVHVPLIYDIDDLVFDEDQLGSIDAYNRMDEVGKNEYRVGVASIRRALTEADFVTTSTSFLAKYIAAEFNKPVWQIPFGVNQRQMDIVEKLEPWRSDFLFIGYLSGTASHQRDFVEVAPALKRILLDHDDVFLKVVGHIDLEEHLPGLEHKVVRIPFMDWQDLLIETSTLAVALAPFDVESAFCQAKSELKFVEQALCGVPTIASKIPAFEEAINNGKNGFIAYTPDDWFHHLNSALGDDARREAVARNARQTVFDHYTPHRIGKRLVSVYEEVMERHSTNDLSLSTFGYVQPKKESDRLSISWIIPQPFEGSGGHRNIFRAIKNLAAFGHRCSLYVTRDDMRFATGADVAAFIAEAFFPLDLDYVGIDFPAIRPCDVLVSTYWTTAYVARENQKNTKLNVFFIQDFEPMFFPMGTDFVRALQSYRFGFHHITSGPWPLRAIENAVGVKGGDYFRFPIDRAIYHCTQAIGHRPRRVAFFARPEMPRRCYDLGISALKIVKDTDPSVEVVLYGSRSPLLDQVPFEAKNLGLTDTIEELADLYRSSALGVCFSTTNPSLVPYELMACGCPVLDLDLNDNHVNYGSSENCVLVDPDPQAIADGIFSVLNDPARGLRIAINGLGYVEDFPDEVEMSRIIERSILKAYQNKNGAVTPQAGQSEDAIGSLNR